MLRGIKAKQFIFMVDPKLGKDSGNSDADQRSHYCNGNCDQNTDQLRCKELCFTIDKAVPLRNRVDICPGKQSSGNAAPDTANTVTAKRIQRVVYLELFL